MGGWHKEESFSNYTVLYDDSIHKDGSGVQRTNKTQGFVEI